MNLFNPTGSGELINNINISKYFNNTFNYNLLYPKSWTRSAIGGDDSIMFKSADNQFIQVIVQPNADKESINSWYKKQFSVTIIDSSRLVTPNTEDWQGVKSEDGLTIYLTDLGANYIYTLTYNPGASSVLNYENIFEMMIDSFLISN